MFTVVGRQYFLQLSRSILEEIKRARQEYERSILAIANIYRNSESLSPFTIPHYDITVVAMDLKVCLTSLVLLRVMSAFHCPANRVSTQVCVVSTSLAVYL